MKYTFEIQEHDHYSTVGWSGGTYIDVEAQDEKEAEEKVRQFFNNNWSARTHFGEGIRFVLEQGSYPEGVKEHWKAAKELYNVNWKKF